MGGKYRDFWTIETAPSIEQCQEPEFFLISEILTKFLPNIDIAIDRRLKEGESGNVSRTGVVTFEDRQKFIDLARSEGRGKGAGMAKRLVNIYGSYIELITFSILVAKANVWILRSTVHDKLVGFDWGCELISRPQTHCERAKNDTPYLLFYSDYGADFSTSHFQAVLKVKKDGMPKCHQTYRLKNKKLFPFTHCENPS